MRRILIVPSVSSSSVIGSESFQELYSFSETVARDERCYWYMVVPPWVRDGIRGHSNLHYVHAETTRDPELNDVIGYSGFDLATWFSRRGGRYVVDAAITDCVQFSWQMSRSLSDPNRSQMPIIVRDLKRSYGEKMDLASLASICVGYSLNSFAATSPYHERDVVRCLKTVVSPAVINLFRQQSFVWPVSSDLEYLDRCRQTVQKHEGLTAFLGGDVRRNGASFVLRVYRRLFAMGIRTMVASFSSESSVRKLLPEREAEYLVDVVANVPRETYYLEAAKAHLFVSCASSEDVFDEEVERLLLGQIGIFPFRDFVFERLGDDYPFFYTPGDEQEAYTMATWVSDHYEEATRLSRVFVDGHKGNLSHTRVFREAWQGVVQRIDEGYKINRLRRIEEKKIPLFNVVYNVAKGLGEEFAMRVFLDVLEEHVPWLKPWGAKGTLRTLGRVKGRLPTMYDLREMLDNLGWIDQCDDAEMILRRERDPLPEVFDGQ